MKFFWIKENTIDWASLNVAAYNNRLGAFVDTTRIPDNKRIKVVLTESFNTLDGTYTPNVSDSIKIVQRAARRSFILLCDGVPVGWATFHNKPTEKPTEETTTDNDADTANYPAEEETNTDAEETTSEPTEFPIDVNFN